MDKLFLIDASGYLYRSYFAIRNMTNQKGESTNALFGFIRSVLKLFKDFNPQYAAAIFDGPRNSVKREAIYQDYKAHRSAMPQDLSYQIKWAHEFCSMMGIAQLNVPEVEADDTMGSVAMWGEQEGASVYLCTSDKDMAQLVTDKILILNTFKDNLILDPAGVEKNYGVPPKQIIDLLAMVGDASDNVPGLPGFGEKTAAALLKSFGSLDYILSHPEEVPGCKKQETIRAEGNKAIISRQLVTIDTAVDFPKEAEFFRLKNPDLEKLKEFYTGLNFHSLIKEMAKWEVGEEVKKEAFYRKGKEDYVFVDDEESFAGLLDFLAKQKEVCLDAKTTLFRPVKTELVGVSFCVEPEKAWFIPMNGKLGKEKVLAGLKTLLEDPKIHFYGHDCKYIIHAFLNYGIQIRNISFDTILAAYILNSSSRQYSLESLALHYLDKIKRTLDELLGKGRSQICIEEADPNQLSEYCCEDADLACTLKPLLDAQLKERKLSHVLYDLELPLMLILAKMERHGIFLDVPHLHHMSDYINKILAELQKQIYDMALEEFNVNSPKKLQEIFHKLGIKLTKKTATGYSTDAEVLEELSESHPIASKILEYRTLEKLRSTYIETLPLEVNEKDHRIHCTFNQTVAATGRLSCQDPNLQNIPLHSEAGARIRESFKPEKKGWSYLAADYSQIELRLLAHLSGDPALLEAFQNNGDIHTFTAAAIYGIPLAQVSKEQRQSAKAVNFGIIYGQQAWGLAKQLHVEPRVAGEFINAYFARYGHVKEFLESCKEKARQTGKAFTMTRKGGAIQRINSKNEQIRAQAERLAINTPFQGTAADLIKMAMLKIDSRLKREQKLGYMILQIHDELIFEVPEFELLDFEHLVREEMQGIWKLRVPLLVDINIGKNWKEC